ncbi:unnamed protein product [Vitrella brassicaformis CCMP3155]|uniref:Alpha-carbonic anhydrase domain-containing protein n=1 Tax=Vitrella brassicaformis (strain CCMP3155) TaxID=1169540 RepID=A0A0G4GLF5_VITBC|nr:unnamed protein product [Vitrella brassicaformis CCMP3155]|mmetsp:Transcript_7554/g.18440  ORF Transcript_7554/g.18440 Transcript_7554/m.18440 type:complete len:328 (+) Transcript_7554:1140-2123(+)|eukprot:CEM30951.1 unnamed protein product [Vitrella brassicaformis CCMP3155]
MPHWDYGRQGADWTNIGQCGNTARQSPINVDDSKAMTMDKTFQYSYKPPAKVIFLNNGHTLEVKATGLIFGNLTFAGAEYVLEQLHFHAPTEHTFGGPTKHRELEMHLLHLNKEGAAAVVSVTFTSSGATAAHPLLTFLGQKPLPESGAEVEVNVNFEQFDLNNLISDTDIFYNYKGSLTTPPCSETVEWFVMKDPLFAKKAQLDVWKSALAYPGSNGNYREIQNSEGASRNAQPLTKVTSRYVASGLLVSELPGNVSKSRYNMGWAAIVSLVAGIVVLMVLIIGVVVWCVNRNKDAEGEGAYMLQPNPRVPYVEQRASFPYQEEEE